MPRSKRRTLGLLAGVATLAVGLSALGPAFGQQSPQSLLPPGFGDPAPAPTAAPPPPPLPGAEGVPSLALKPPVATDIDAGDEALAEQQVAEQKAAADAEAAATALRKQDVPDLARHPTDHIGILSSGVTGIPADGFGSADGRFVATLMRRLDAPIASRWLSMLLRRVLTTDIQTPANIQPADWVADRAALLARMGEADAARLLVQRIDSDTATPRYYDAVLQAMLASADPAGLCPVADQAEPASADPAWSLVRAMCAGLSGEGGTASALVDRARSLRGGQRGIDLLLAERVIGAGVNAKRSPDILWSQVNDLSPWRFGLGSALGLEIPANLLDGGGLAMQAWRARAPMLPIAGRLGADRVAATLGVVSAADLVDAYSAAAEDGDPLATDGTPAGRLRAAYIARSQADRMTALRALWADPANERDAYAGRILTAYAAERVAPSADYGDDAAALIAAMLSAGLDVPAARWGGVVQGLKGNGGAEARALLAVGSPARTAFDPDAIADFGDGGRGAARLRAQYLFATLAGLGRLDPAQVNALAGELGVPVGGSNLWTRAIDGAATRREAATVVVLAAVGMQTSDWTQVHPVFLYHIVAALHAVGFDAEARMIAAESLSRT